MPIPFAALGIATSVPKWLGVVIQFFSFLFKHWKETLILAGIIWAVTCSNLHCGKRSVGGSGYDTLSVRIDTFYPDIDTNAIFAVYGFDTLPDYVARLEQRKWEGSTPDLAVASNTSDSLQEYVKAYEQTAKELEECDSTFREETAIRTYLDTVSNDTMVFYLATDVQGRRLDVPSLRYRRTKPYPVIVKTVTVQEPAEEIGPYRKLYIGLGGGPKLYEKTDKLNAAMISGRFGYTDKKNMSYGLRASYFVSTMEEVPNQYSVEFEWTISLDLKFLN